MTEPGRRDLTCGAGDWAGLDVVVAGIGLSGFAAADALVERGARVTVVDARAGDGERERATVLEVLGAQVRLGPEHLDALPATATGGGSGVDGASPALVIASPGWRPDQPLLADAARRGVPVWGEVELAWRMRPATGAAPWLTLTGTNGKTTTVRMLTAMLTAAGHRATAAGNVGTPLLEAVLHPQPYDVLAVELSSFQLHSATSLSPLASACLNVAPDHVDWHGSMAAYAAAKGRVYRATQVACVYNVADPVTEQLVRDADVVEGARAVGFTLGVPGVGMLGVVEDVLCDRAFVAERATAAAELATLADLAGGGLAGSGLAGSAAEQAGAQQPVAPHTVENALAAAALARAFGVPPVAVRDALRSFTPDPHRMAQVAVLDGVRFVDDSKATNPHAASASLRAFDPVVWVAGGLAKGADFEPLVAAHAGRLRAVVLLGRERGQLRQALQRHAPDVPVVEVEVADTGPVQLMDEVVKRAAGLARPGDVVLLAPACASMDQFASYVERGETFSSAVRRRARGRG